MKKLIKVFSFLSIVMLLTGGLTQKNIQAQEDKINVLLLGTDAGYEADRNEALTGSRTDAIMILTLDPNENKLSVSTIPRDSLVDIPGHGQDKVNHAFAYGGLDLTLETLENWLGIEFDHYVVSNMPGFVNIIDQLGGVSVIPPTTFNWWETYFFEKDVPQDLDGDHALAYARERFTSGGDYARQARMREMMIVIINRLISEGSIEQYRDLFENRYEYILTDVTFDEIVDYYEQYANLDLFIEEFQLSGEGMDDPDLGYIDITDAQSFEELLAIIQ